MSENNLHSKTNQIKVSNKSTFEILYKSYVQCSLFMETHKYFIMSMLKL